MKDQPLVNQLLCVALVASLMVPAGQMIFPYVSDVFSGLEFNAIEAVVSATVGLGIHAMIFG